MTKENWKLLALIVVAVIVGNFLTNIVTKMLPASASAVKTS